MRHLQFERVNPKTHPQPEAVKKPSALSTKKLARVFCESLWPVSVGLFFRSFQLAAASSFLKRIQCCRL
jgi:hypothetical protein